MDLNELNKVVGDEIYKLRAGKTKPERLNAISRAGTVMVRNATVQLAAMRAFGGNRIVPEMFGLQKLAKALPHKKNGR